MYSLIFEIPGLPKTVNQIGRRHWAVKMKEAQEWKLGVMCACMGKKPLRPLKVANIFLTRFSRVRPDYDNLVNSFKAVLDGLIDAGIIENDRHENIGVPIYNWKKYCIKGGKIKVEVYAT